MFGDLFGRRLDKPLGRIARHIPVSPDLLTVTGFLVTVCASVVIVSDPRLGGVLIIVGGAFDMLDGAVARSQGKATRFGAFLDSLLDRYSDSFVLIGLAAHLLRRDDFTGVLLCLVSLVGSFAVSYARARAEGLGLDCKVGIMERPERLLLLSFGTITGILIPALWLLSILTHVTALQRVWRVWQQT